jgi:hypothetical protein
VSDRPVTGGQRHSLATEALTFGLAYGAGLCWASVCLLASFRPADLSDPYWSAIPHLRADTSGVLAFFAVAVFLTCSEFLRLSRRQAGTAAAPDSSAPGERWPALAALAAAETVAILATGLVVYLSVNTVSHPASLNMQATHLAPWPTEGTLRVIALVLCVCSASQVRAARVRAGRVRAARAGR